MVHDALWHRGRSWSRNHITTFGIEQLQDIKFKPDHTEPQSLSEKSPELCTPNPNPHSGNSKPPNNPQTAQAARLRNPQSLKALQSPKPHEHHSIRAWTFPAAFSVLLGGVKYFWDMTAQRRGCEAAGVPRRRFPFWGDDLFMQGRSKWDSCNVKL